MSSTRTVWISGDVGEAAAPAGAEVAKAGEGAWPVSFGDGDRRCTASTQCERKGLLRSGVAWLRT